MTSRELKRRLRRLQEIYNSLPRVDCQRKCAASCGPIVWTRIEHENIRKAVSGEFRIMADRSFPACPYLDGDRCTIYESRPLVCRLFGLIAKTPCPWGCKPERWLADEEVTAVYDELIALYPVQLAVVDSCPISIDSPSETSVLTGLAPRRRRRWSAPRWRGRKPRGPRRHDD